MTQLVEGDWKDFTFRMLGQEDFSVLTEHIRNNFLADEPIMRAVFGSSSIIDPILSDKEGANVVEVADVTAFSASIGSCVDEGLSFAAYHKQSGKMAGVRLISRQIKGRDRRTGADAPAFSSVKAKIVAGFIQKTDSGVDIFKLYNVDQYAELRIASVDQEFRRLGLATEMYRRAVTFLQHCGEFVVAKGIFTSPYTRGAAIKFNFQELSRRYLSQLEDLEGDIIWPEADEEIFAAVMVLKILPIVSHVN